MQNLLKNFVKIVPMSGKGITIDYIPDEDLPIVILIHDVMKSIL